MTYFTRAETFTVICDELALALLEVVGSGGASEELRCQAALSLGPLLEHADTDDFEDDAPISEPTFHKVQESLRACFKDTDVPQQVRRRVLEASVRAPLDWHQDAVRVASGSAEEAWRLTSRSAPRPRASIRTTTTGSVPARS